MLRIKSLLSLVVAPVLFLTMVSSYAAEATQAYKLHQGDLLQVSVWGEDKLQNESLVLPDGSITYPLAGRVEVVGLTSVEVEKRIAEKLKPYLPDPQVSVVITKIAGNSVHVLGKVMKPGQVLMAGPMRFLEALSISGGFDKFAEKSSIKVIRNTPTGQKAIPISNYDQLIKGENLDNNILLMPGDTIVVP
jgi:polysaccharide export outer membrane protein